MKRFISLALFAMCMTIALAQPGPHRPRPPFDPQKFEKELEQFIVTEAGLTPAESARFFPLYKEMRRKQMAFFSDMQKDRFADMSNDKECRRIIREADKRDIDLKMLQSEYHERFMQVLSPSKALKVIRAEEKFHRKIFKKAAWRDGKRGGPK